MRTLAVLWLFPILALAQSGAEVVVIYNTRVPDSKELANYYAELRKVPATQVWGFDLATSEGMSRADYLEKLQTPLLRKLEEARLWTWQADGAGKPRRLAAAKARYAVLCWGVPTKILQDTNFVEKGTESARPELRRNEASVDSQLACLPLIEQNPVWAGPLRNPAYGATNAALLHPTNGIFLVTRLDGPTADVAAGLIQKAMQAETNGLWGRAYIDARGITNGGYAQGDEWLRRLADMTRVAGFETEVDQDTTTFSAAYPMSQIAFYAGWYDWNASGPFTRREVEFMPGAFAYHLHSFSAQTLRSTNANWVGPLLHKGATITMGNVDEPYLAATPDLPVFFKGLLGGFTFAEAAWSSQNSISWQTVMVGDPVYRPYGRPPQEIVADLDRRRSSLLEWAVLRDVNVRLLAGQAMADDIIAMLENAPLNGLTRQSAVLTEKLADLYWSKKKFSDALDFYEAALKRYPSAQQKVRLLLLLGQRRTLYGQEQKAIESYRQLLKEFPDYPDKLGIYQRLLPLVQKTADKKEIENIEAEIKRLSPATSAPVAK